MTGSDLDLLLAHGAFVRSLARRIVADEHRAEDLAQETWLAALSRPADSVRKPRAWLAGILANLTRSDVRARARRERRETESASDSSSPSAASTVEAAALGRDLADRVLALDEPFRTAILLRYYEDLPPRAIARRTSVPVRTVNSRLARGLERLRSGLRRDGADRSWLGGLVVLARPAEIAGTGVLWMNAKPVVAIAAAIAVTAGTLVWMRAGGSASSQAERSSAPIEAPSLDRATPAAAPLVAEAEPSSTRAPGAAPAEPREVRETTPPPSTTRRIRGRVFGPEALPLAGVEVAFESDSSTAPRATSGGGGVFELEVPSSRDGTVRTTDPHLVDVAVGRVRAGREAEPIVVVAPARDLGGKVVDLTGAPLAGVQLALEPPEGFLRRFDVVLDSTERSDVHATSDAAGAFALPRSAGVPGARVVAKLDGFETAFLDAPLGTDLGLVVEMRSERADSLEIAGSVVDAQGASAAEAYVSLGEQTAVTDSRGEFRLAIAGAEAAVDLVAVRPGSLPGRFRAERDLASGKPIWPAHVVVKLGESPLAIRGTVVDGEGKPRSNVRIWVEDPTRFGVLGEDDVAMVESLVGAKGMDGDAYWRSTSTTAEGRFELGGLLDREYRLGLIDERSLDLVHAGPFAAAAAGVRDVRIVFESSPARRIEGRVLSARGQPVPGVALDLMRPTFGGISTSLDRGVRICDAEGRFAFEDVRGKELLLWVRGDDVVPAMILVPDAIGEEGFTITVAVRCHFKVHLSGALASADRLRVLDAEGVEMDLMEVTPSGVTTMKHATIVGGLSAALGVAEQAWTLSILKGEQELARRELHLAPGILNVIDL